MKYPPDGTIFDYNLWIGGETVLLLSDAPPQEQLENAVSELRTYIARLQGRLSILEQGAANPPPFVHRTREQCREAMGLTTHESYEYYLCIDLNRDLYVLAMLHGY